MRLGTSDARMNAAAVRIGLTGGDMGISYFLPRMIGSSAAAEFLLTGRFIESGRAHALGLLSKVRDLDSLHEDSMIGAGIYEGDALLVDRSMDPKHNNIVIAQLNNEFTVKRLYRRGGVVKLVAENPIYPARLIKEEDDFVVWGVVTFNLHKLC